MIRKIAYIVLILCIHISANADWQTGDYPDTIEITSLPYEINTDSTVYILSGNLQSATWGIKIYNNSYIKIAGRGDTITFDASSSGNVVGMEISGTSKYIVVENLTVTQYQTASPVEYGSHGGSDVTGLYLSYAEWIKILQCNFHVSGHDSRVVNGWDANLQAIEIHGGNYTTFSRSYDSRHSQGSAVMWLGDNSAKSNPDTFHYYIHEITIDSACHAGILVGGIAWVDSNNVTIDAFNENTNATWANAHAIADAGKAWAGSHFRYNTIRSGTTHYGGRGMYANFAAGTADSPVEFAYNDIRVSQGYSGPGEAIDGRGMRFRWGCFYLRVHHNYIEIDMDGDDATEYMEHSGHGIMYTGVGLEGSDTGAYNWFYNNEIHMDWNGGTDAEPDYVGGIIIDQAVKTGYPYGNNNMSFNNHIYSNVRCLQYNGVNGVCNEFTSYRDTIEWIQPSYEDGWGWEGPVGVGGWNLETLNNRLIDPIFIGCDYESITNRSGSGTKSIYVMRTVELAIAGNNGLPVSGATVHIWPKQAYADSTRNDRAVTYRTTGSGGVIYDTLSYKYNLWENTAYSDSTYNPYRIRAVMGNDTTWTSLTLGDNTGIPGYFVRDTLVLQNTSGDGEWGDPDTANFAPSAPTPDSTYSTSDSDYQYLKPTFVVTNGSDPDGDALTYEFQLYNADKTEIITSGSGISEGAGTTSWTIPDSVPSNTVYFWRARCYDGQAYSPWSDWSEYSPPVWEGGFIPTPGSIINSTNPTLSIHNGHDPNSNDILTYEFAIFNSAESTLVASALNITEGNYYTSWTVPLGLDDNTSYFWHARCTDGMNYSPWNELSDFTVIIGSDQNNPPSVPFHASPPDDGTIVSTPIVLTVNNSLDNENDDITYDFFLYSDVSLNQLEEEQTDIPETADQTSATFSFTPYEGQRLWWQARANDGSNNSALTSATSFTYTTLGTGGKDNIPITAIPADGSVINIRQPILVAQNITVSGDNYYYFQLSSESDFYDPIETSDAIPEEEGDQTRWQVTSELEPGQTYYWRVRVNYYAFSDAASFTIGSKIIAYPNPVSFLKGDDITFQLPDEPVDLLIQSVSGETVLVKNGISGEWHWTGHNELGNIVSVGVYLWFIRNSDQNGKIVVKP